MKKIFILLLIPIFYACNDPEMSSISDNTTGEKSTEISLTVNEFTGFDPDEIQWTNINTDFAYSFDSNQTLDSSLDSLRMLMIGSINKLGEFQIEDSISSKMVNIFELSNEFPIKPILDSFNYSFYLKIKGNYLADSRPDILENIAIWLVDSLTQNQLDNLIQDINSLPYVEYANYQKMKPILFETDSTLYISAKLTVENHNIDSLKSKCLQLKNNSLIESAIFVDLLEQLRGTIIITKIMNADISNN